MWNDFERKIAKIDKNNNFNIFWIKTWKDKYFYIDMHLIEN